MTLKSKILAIAAKEVGYKQAANSSNKYGQWYGADRQPWCAMFLSWCAAQAGIDSGIIPKFAYVPHGVDHYKKQGRFRPAKGYIPQTGDIVFYDFNGNGTPDHVGIVTGYGGGMISTIEGNTSSVSQANGGAVERKQRNAVSGVAGYGLPKYGEEEDMEIKEIAIANLDTGKDIMVSAVNIEGKNYVELRDLEALFPVTIGNVGKKPTMKLNYK